MSAACANFQLPWRTEPEYKAEDHDLELVFAKLVAVSEAVYFVY